jgi:hypothetical protein
MVGTGTVDPGVGVSLCAVDVTGYACGMIDAFHPAIPAKLDL